MLSARKITAAPVATAGQQKDKFLAVVPESRYQNPKIPAESKTFAWSSQYNVAAWLCVHAEAETPCELVVRYLDSRGWNELVIDHGKTNLHRRILLSGVALLPARGRIMDMKLYLRSDVANIKLEIEELFVQKVEEKKRNHRLAASF